LISAEVARVAVQPFVIRLKRPAVLPSELDKPDPVAEESARPRVSDQPALQATEVYDHLGKSLQNDQDHQDQDQQMLEPETGDTAKNDHQDQDQQRLEPCTTGGPVPDEEMPVRSRVSAPEASRASPQNVPHSVVVSPNVSASASAQKEDPVQQDPKERPGLFRPIRRTPSHREYHNKLKLAARPTDSEKARGIVAKAAYDGYQQATDIWVVYGSRDVAYPRSMFFWINHNDPGNLGYPKNVVYDDLPALKHGLRAFKKNLVELEEKFMGLAVIMVTAEEAWRKWGVAEKVHYNITPFHKDAQELAVLVVIALPAGFTMVIPLETFPKATEPREWYLKRQLAQKTGKTVQQWTRNLDHTKILPEWDAIFQTEGLNVVMFDSERQIRAWQNTLGRVLTQGWKATLWDIRPWLEERLMGMRGKERWQVVRTDFTGVYAGRIAVDDIFFFFLEEVGADPIVEVLGVTEEDLGSVYLKYKGRPHAAKYEAYLEAVYRQALAPIFFSFVCCCWDYQSTEQAKVQFNRDWLQKAKNQQALEKVRYGDSDDPQQGPVEQGIRTSVKPHLKRMAQHHIARALNWGVEMIQHEFYGFSSKFIRQEIQELLPPQA